MPNEKQQFGNWLEEKRKKGTADNLTQISIESYKYLTENLFNSHSNILYNPDELIKYMNEEIKQRKNPVTLFAFRNVLEFLGYEEQKFKIKTDVIQKSALKSAKELQSKVLTVNELRMLDNAMEKDWEKMILGILYDGALRQNEISELKVRDIIFRPFNLEKPKKPGAIVQILGKGSKRRQVYFSHRTSEIVKLWIKNNNLQQENFLFQFRKKNGEAYKSQGYELWKWISDKGELILNRKVHPHCLRHSKATHMASVLNPNILGISKYLGHSDISTSQIYIEISPTMARHTWEEQSIDYTREDFDDLN